MNSKEWGMFFVLLDKVINMPNLTADEKRDKTLAMAKTLSGETALEEFVSWFGGDATETVM